ncbi:MAG TPA: hypothetical protein VD907_05785 [Verrucomicrobiae bacterium]|nr:hypothetical protein [Verrucomicrobiae bacterium]
MNQDSTEDDECGVAQAQALAVDIDEDAFEATVDVDWCDCYYDLPDLGNGISAQTSLLASINEVTSL